MLLPRNSATSTCSKSLLSTFPTRNKVRSLHRHPRMQKSARAEAVRSCAARVRIFGSSHNHESHGCSRIQGMRAMEAVAEITLERHEVCCRGSEIIPATRFPAETSCLGPNFVSSTCPHNPKWFVAFATKPDRPNTSSIKFPAMRL